MQIRHFQYVDILYNIQVIDVIFNDLVALANQGDMHLLASICQMNAKESNFSGPGYPVRWTEITIMAPGKIPKVQIHEEKSNFQERYFSMLLLETNELLHRRESEFDCLLLFSRIASPVARRAYRILHNVKNKDTIHPSNPNWADKCYMIPYLGKGY